MVKLEYERRLRPPQYVVKFIRIEGVPNGPIFRLSGLLVTPMGGGEAFTSEQGKLAFAVLVRLFLSGIGYFLWISEALFFLQHYVDGSHGFFYAGVLTDVVGFAVNFNSF
jgi:hypothetical protein